MGIKIDVVVYYCCSVEETEKMRELVGLVFGGSRIGGFIQNCTIDIYILSVHAYCITFANFSYETPAGGYDRRYLLVWYLAKAGQLIVCVV